MGRLIVRKFLSEEFFVIDGRVSLDGLADPGSIVTVYQVVDDSGGDYGPLSVPLTASYC